MKMAKYCGLALVNVLVAGACSGKLAVLDEPVDAAGNPLTQGAQTAGAQGAAAAPGAGCPELAVEEVYPPRAPLVTCGSCACVEGEVVCDEGECPVWRGIPACEELTARDAVVLGSRIEGERLFLSLQGWGGCDAREQSFHVCYVPPYASRHDTQATYPKTATLLVQNPASPSSCDRVAFEELELDLRTLAVFASDAGGLVDTRFGLVQVGELTCFDRGRIASSRFDYLINEAGLWDGGIDISCTTDADCEASLVGPSCASSCGNAAASHAGFAELRARVAAIESEFCLDTVACPEQLPFSPEGCSEQWTARCVSGECRAY